ncbi:hypothetical protein [Plantactinospora sp. CA-290183]|uniref:hypothetical protein n=1 Tax=Plantactinospora sp. CA-290183 TaxID=3240006 RepID=UPI003D8F196C
MMTIGSENLGNGAAKPDRFVGKYRGARRDGGTAVEEPLPVPELGSPENRVPDLPPERPRERLPSLPSLDGLTEPVFPPPDWPDLPAEPLVDHPLLRGLLLELPPKGTMPDPAWLDRWFEAARSILELLYVQDARRPR